MQITENVRDIMRSPEYVLNSLTEHSENLNYKFERLYRIFFNEEMYYVAYQRIYAKPGNMTAGADGKTIDQMSLNRIEQLITSLKDESYQPQPSKRMYIPKKNGKMRPLGVPAFNDKLLQEVVRMILEAIYERQFEKTSHGFRPLRSCHTVYLIFTGRRKRQTNQLLLITVAHPDKCFKRLVIEILAGDKMQFTAVSFFHAKI